MKINAWKKVACLLCSESPTKRKHNEVTSKTKYETLKELDKNRPNKEVPFSSTFLEGHLLFGKKTKKSFAFQSISKHFKIHHWHDSKNQRCNIWKSLFTEDSGFDLLISKLIRVTSQGRRAKMRQSSINDFFKQQWT